MAVLELPHTPNCLVCGRNNPHGLHLSLCVDSASGIVTTTFTPLKDHIGFEGIIHGGIIATVLDEAMVWAATWAGKRFCVCAELTARFKESALVGIRLIVTARIEQDRRKLIMTLGEVKTSDGVLIATASGKYVPLTEEKNRGFVATLVDSPDTSQTAAALRK